MTRKIYSFLKKDRPVTAVKKEMQYSFEGPGGGGALGYFLGGYVPPRTPNWYPVLKKISPKIDTPF